MEDQNGHQVTHETLDAVDKNIEGDKENITERIDSQEVAPSASAASGAAAEPNKSDNFSFLVPELPVPNQVPAASAASSALPRKSADAESKKTTKARAPTAKKTVARTSAQLLKEQPLAYKEPTWGGRCVKPFHLEVLKNGCIVDKVDLTKKSFFVFGRLQNCDVVMEHPSLSRHHAIIQYCGADTERRQEGWYLYDLDSTHGTWLNKSKVQGRLYHRLHVGFMVKFGGSSRLHVLQGPEDDAEPESELSISEMKAKKEERQKEVELLKLALQEQAENEKAEQEKTNEGCSWGMGEDAMDTDFDVKNPFSLEEPQNEHLYIEDPKKALKGFFEREGYDPPEYEFLEEGLGNRTCRVELPIDTPNGQPLFAEVSISGKKKEAVVACALEACKILDRQGLLRQAKHESRKRKTKNWAEEDYYDSDEDTFLDRTGDIEKKRTNRMKRSTQGKKKQKAETFESLSRQLEEVESEIEKVTKQLENAASEKAQSSSRGMDELDAYMNAIKSGALDTKTRIKLKTQMFELKKEQQRLQRLVNMARPASMPAKVSGGPLSPKALPLFGKRKFPATSIRTALQQPTTKGPSKPAANDAEEEEDEDDGGEHEPAKDVPQLPKTEQIKTEDTKSELKSVTGQSEIPEKSPAAPVSQPEERVLSTSSGSQVNKDSNTDVHMKTGVPDNNGISAREHIEAQSVPTVPPKLQDKEREQELRKRLSPDVSPIEQDKSVQKKSSPTHVSRKKKKVPTATLR